MPRKKKQAHELTTDEAVRKLFPKEVVAEAKREAGKAANRGIKKKPS
jgi:hypothetical protein